MTPIVSSQGLTNSECLDRVKLASSTGHSSREVTSNEKKSGKNR
jgi:hypothetical protein